jgi:membrane-associated protease RseP (regulator of RpoE activity)
MIASTLLIGLLPLLQGLALEPGQKVVVEPAQQQGSGPARIQLRPAQGEARDLVFLAPQDTDRAWIGVVLATEESEGPGVAVGSVSGDSPAERAGLQPGDRIVALAGKRLSGYEALIARLRELRPGQEVGLALRRELVVGLDRRGWGEDEGPRLGVSLSEQETDAGFALEVTEVRDGWPAAQAGLRVGDRIVAADRQALGSFDRLQDALASTEPGRELGLTVERRVELTLGRYPGQAVPEPGQGWFFEVPDVPTPPEGLPQPPQEGFRVWPTPLPDAEARPRAVEMQALREELRALSEELRSLREELSALRAELAELRRSRDR